MPDGSVGPNRSEIGGSLLMPIPLELNVVRYGSSDTKSLISSESPQAEEAGALFSNWLKEEMQRRKSTGASIERFTDLNRSTIARLSSDMRLPTLKTFSTLVEFFGSSDQEVYDLISGMVPDKFKPTAKRGVLSPDTLVLKGTSTEQLGEYLRLSKISMGTLAARTGINKSTLSRISRNERVPKTEIFARLALALELSPEQVRGYLRSFLDDNNQFVEMHKNDREVAEPSSIKDTREAIAAGNGSVLEIPDGRQKKVKKSSLSPDTNKVEPPVIWVDAKKLTPQALGNIYRMYKDIFGEVPEGGDVDLDNPDSLNEIHQSLMQEMFEGMGYAEIGLLDIRRMINEKGNFLRFKTARITGIPDDAKKIAEKYLDDKGIGQNSRIASTVKKKYLRSLAADLQRRIDEYLISHELSLNNRQAVGKPFASISVDVPVPDGDIVEQKTEEERAA